MTRYASRTLKIILFSFSHSFESMKIEYLVFVLWSGMSLYDLRVECRRDTTKGSY